VACEHSGEQAGTGEALVAIASAELGRPTTTAALSALNAQSGADDPALRSSVDKLIASAAALARIRRWQQASKLLRHAYALGYEKAVQGSLLGRTTCAGVAVQYCALLSRFGHHSLALREAMTACREADEVWNIVEAACLQLQSLRETEDYLPQHVRSNLMIALDAPPCWVERTVLATIQARHCVAVEMEYTAQQGVGNPLRGNAMRELAVAFHQEARDLAVKLLPQGHPMQQLSLCTCGQAQDRWPLAKDDNEHYGCDQGLSQSQFSGKGSREQTEEMPSQGHENSRTLEGGGSVTATETAKVGDLLSRSSSSIVFGTEPSDAALSESRPGSAPMARKGSTTSWGKRTNLIDRPPSATCSEAVKDALGIQPLATLLGANASSSPKAHQTFSDEGGHRRLSGARETSFRGSLLSVPGSELLGLSRRSSRSGSKNKRRRGEPTDIFSEWMNHNIPRSAKDFVAWKLGTENGVEDLQEQMRHESMRFRHIIIPQAEPQHMFDARTRFSKYGMKVHKEAQRRRQQPMERKPLYPGQPFEQPQPQLQSQQHCRISSQSGTGPLPPTETLPFAAGTPPPSMTGTGILVDGSPESGKRSSIASMPSVAPSMMSMPLPPPSANSARVSMVGTSSVMSKTSNDPTSPVGSAMSACRQRNRNGPFRSPQAAELRRLAERLAKSSQPSKHALVVVTGR